MAPLQLANSIARCAFRGVAAGVNIVNVLHVQKDPVAGPYSQAEIDALATALGTIYTTRFVPQLNFSYTAAELVCTDLSTHTGVVGVKTMTGTGGDATTTQGNAACVCISWKISKHYRGGHPRTYLGPVGAAKLTNGTTLTPAYVTAVTTAANGFLNDVNALAVTGSPYKLVALHRTQGGTTLIPPGLSFITAAQVDSRLDTQRRRLGKDR
jgi:hypothetical protein